MSQRAADLPLNRSNSGINRGIHITRQLAGSVIGTVVMNCDLSPEASTLQAEGDKGFGLSLKEAVEL